MRLATGLMLAALLGSAALAATSVIEQRQQLMKNNAAALKALAPMAQQKAPFDAGVVKQQAAIIMDDLEKAKGLFPEGSGKGPPETWAKPEIWQNLPKFAALADDGIKAARNLSAVTSEQEFGPALQAMGAACKACHEPFRRPKE